MIAHKAETAVQVWSVDRMEDVILTHTPVVAKDTTAWNLKTLRFNDGP